MGRGGGEVGGVEGIKNHRTKRFELKDAGRTMRKAKECFRPAKFAPHVICAPISSTSAPRDGTCNMAGFLMASSDNPLASANPSGFLGGLGYKLDGFGKEVAIGKELAIGLGKGLVIGRLGLWGTSLWIRLLKTKSCCSSSSISALEGSSLRGRA